MGRSNFIHVCFFSTSKGFWVEKWDCRCEKSWFAQSTWVQLGKFGRSDEDEEGDPEMEKSKEKISLGRVLGERQKQVFCHDSALALEITGIPRIPFWRSSSEQCVLANAFRRFATASAILGDHQALVGRLMLLKGMAEAAASLRSLVKV